MKYAVFTLTVIFLLVSCRSQDLIRPGDSLQVAFEKAYAQFEQENWRDASQAFETVISIGRGTEFGQDAQFYLAESYFNDRRYMMAASEYERYSSSHPNSERREYSDFMIGKSYYNLSPRFNIDQTYTYRAIEQFRLYMARYPNSDRITEAGERIDELRNKLARKEFEAGEFYMRTGRYNAATVSYDLVIDRYPESRWAERALVRKIEAYVLYADNSIPARQEERYRKAVEAYDTYIQLFPRGDNRSDAEDHYDRALTALEQITDEDEDVITARGGP